MMNKHVDDELDRIIRAYSVVDPHELGEDKFSGHHDIGRVKAELLAWRSQGVEEANIRRNIAQELQSQIAKYGDGEVVRFNGEAIVPISKVLEIVTPLEQKGNQS